MRTRWVVGALLLTACETAPEWTGRYEGTLLSEAVDCETGEQLDPVTQDLSVSIVTLDGRLTIDGACPVGLEKTGDTTARIVPSTCETTLSDGTPATLQVLNGRAALDGDELSFDVATRLMRGGFCDSGRDTFVGTRR